MTNKSLDQITLDKGTYSIGMDIRNQKITASKMPVVGKRYKGLNSGLTYESLLAKENKILLESKPHILWFDFDTFWDYFEELPDSNPQEEPQDEIDKMYQLEVDIIRLESDLNIKKGMLRIMERNRVNKTPNLVDLEKGEVSEIDRALEELKKAVLTPISADLNEDMCDVWRRQYFLLNNHGWNLVNALEAERSERAVMSKPEIKIDMKEERVEPVSIWKDVSELPKVCGTVLIKWRNLTGVEMAYFYAGDESFYTDSNCNDEDEFVKQNIEKCCLLTDFINSFEQMKKDFEELKRRR